MAARLVRALLAAALLALPAAPAAAATRAAPAAAPTPPGQDPFYSYTGATPLARIAPGTVLKQRAVQLAFGATTTPLSAEQLLYRTAGELGQPTVTVTTVLVPQGALAAPRLLGYLSFYDALGAQCDPSYTLRGGDPGAANSQQVQAEEALIGAYLANGYLVTVPDFEGTDLEWTAGHEAGYDSLDALRATESYLHLPASTPAGLTGYSGGSIAAEWAAEIAPAYAPGLHLVGVAAGGVPVDYAHNLGYINGSAGWSGIIPAVLVALSRAYRIDLAPYLSPYGAQLAAQVQHACIGSFNGAYPGLTIGKLLKPAYQDFLAIPVFVHVVNDLIMGSVAGRPHVPLLLGVGNADGTGDGVMVAADVEGLAHEYCTQGLAVQFSEYSGASHTQAALDFEPAAMAFLQQRFLGVPFSGNCAQVGTGNSLRPLSVPQQSPPPHGATAVPPAAAAARSDGGLAGTGLPALVPLAALAVLAAGFAVGYLRRRTGGA